MVQVETAGSWRTKKAHLTEQACELLFHVSALKFGSFKLTSGKSSPFYIDLRIVPSYPEVFDKITDMYVLLIKNEADEFDRVAGVPTAGLPIATLVSYKLRAPLLYVRKTAKNHGTQRAVEGVLNDKDRVLLIDDLATTGSSLLDAARAIRSQGGIVAHAVVLIDREQGCVSNLSSNGIKLHYLMKVSQLLETLYRKGLITHSEYQSSIEYIKHEQI
ncbi:MAG: orotate phosphoribosyltransferase [Candidatus Jordarchaeales archaeon]